MDITLIEKFLVLTREINSINNQIDFLLDMTFSNSNKRDLERLHKLIEKKQKIREQMEEFKLGQIL